MLAASVDDDIAEHFLSHALSFNRVFNQFTIWGDPSLQNAGVGEDDDPDLDVVIWLLHMFSTRFLVA